MKEKDLSRYLFPIIGKSYQNFSNHWKIFPQFFQSLENSPAGYGPAKTTAQQIQAPSQHPNESYSLSVGRFAICGATLLGEEEGSDRAEPSKIFEIFFVRHRAPTSSFGADRSPADAGAARPSMWPPRRKGSPRRPPKRPARRPANGPPPRSQKRRFRSKPR